MNKNENSASPDTGATRPNCGDNSDDKNTKSIEKSIDGPC